MSLVFTCCPGVNGDDSTSTRPTVGLVRRPFDTVALVGGKVFIRPDVQIDNATILLRGTTFTAVGKKTEIAIPVGAEVIDCDGLTLYPGLIDSWSEVEVPDPAQNRGAPHWNGNVIPQRDAVNVVGGSTDDNKKLRSQGITVRLIAPAGGIVQGSSCAMLINDKTGREAILAERVWQHLQLTVPKGASRDAYPTSPMGAVALLRQTFHDANWYRDALAVYASNKVVQRPEQNTALQTLNADRANRSFLIDAPNERMAIRASDFANEFALPVILKGSGREYRNLDEIVSNGRPILIPVDFPAPPNAAVEAVEQRMSTTRLMHWKLAPENPGRLSAAGATFCLTSAGLKDTTEFLKQIRVAVKRGLSSEAALSALTQTPAKLMGIDRSCGTIAPGKLANLLITDRDLFDEKCKVLTVWVGGERFQIAEEESNLKKTEMPPGRWHVTLKADLPASYPIRFEVSEKGEIHFSSALESPKRNAAPKAELSNLVVERHRWTGTFDFSRLDERWPVGPTRVTLVFANATNQNPLMQVHVYWPSGATSQAMADRFKRSKLTMKTSPGKEPKANQASDSTETRSEKKPSQMESTSPIEILYPLANYGMPKPVTQVGPVMFRGATVWTCAAAGKLENVDVLVRDGIIEAIGSDLPIPESCEVVSLLGKHLSPGLIDCHSHIATDGGVNEVGQAITSEVRIGDFIDPSEPAIYRQLASGVTAANILHGSANPIGGQNAVIKLRWGGSMDELVMEEAPKGIKFALGENVKQSNGGGSGRYPGSRMGVEQIIRDQLLAARLYDAEHRRYRAGDSEGLPPRVDLQLEALAEVLRGERWIHCHSYRQDEIVAFLNLLEEFNIQVGTLQHVLEGYKVAEKLKQHGAMASSFADWWGYKFEVFDAIPYNGALMHREGVIVSYNSDDRELGTHLNTEAAKAVKYGGVSEEEALKFVTINPALQLRIDKFTGSIELGKDADLAIWSGPPLSSLSRCEQTWVDGKRYFAIDQDAKLRERDAKIRAQLIAEILAGRAKDGATQDDTDEDNHELNEEDRWFRFDAYCGCRKASEQVQREGSNDAQ